MIRGLIAGPIAALLALVALPAAAQDAPAICSFGSCQVRVTAEQLLSRAELLVQNRRFGEAEPMIAALAMAPGMKLQSRFLAGYAASQQGQFGRAAEIFKGILADDPAQIRARLELARAMLSLGQFQSADRQFRMAQQDDLPPDIARFVRGARDVIRSQRSWQLDMDFGIAPDSNINNATRARSIDVQLGEITLPLDLDGSARAKSGTGQVAMLNASTRMPVSGATTLLVDVNSNGTNYAGKDFDDYSLQGAAGPQLRLGDDATVFVQGLAAQRWYGGRSASRQFGARLGGQLALNDHARLGLQLDARRTDALFDSSFSGWQLGLYANGERALSRTFVASAGLFTRRDALTSKIYSNVELGGSLGVAGELPWGVNVGLNGVVSRALYDSPFTLFSDAPRRDWRFSTSLSLGNRKLRFMGFSPQVSIGWSKTASSLPIFANDRLRVRFSAARFF